MWAWTSVWTVWATHWSDWSLKTKNTSRSVNKLLKRQMSPKGLLIKLLASHPNFLFHQLPGVVDLLRGAPNCEHFDVGISVGWRIPLQLDPGSGLLADALDCLPT